SLGDPHEGPRLRDLAGDDRRLRLPGRVGARLPGDGQAAAGGRARRAGRRLRLRLVPARRVRQGHRALRHRHGLLADGGDRGGDEARRGPDADAGPDRHDRGGQARRRPRRRRRPARGHRDPAGPVAARDGDEGRPHHGQHARAPAGAAAAARLHDGHRADSAGQGRRRSDAVRRRGTALSVRLAHDRRGSGPPVVLIHGLGGTSASIWKHLPGDLAAEFDVVTYDIRGAGGSERVPGPYSLDDFVADLRGLVEELGLERPALVGHSFGGSIALAYAARYPGEAAAVVSAGGPVVLPEAGQQGMRDRAETVEAQGMGAVAETVATNGMAPSFREAHPDKFREYVHVLAANDPASYAATCRVIAEMDLTAE